MSPPDLFTAETPLGTYQGMTDQVVMSGTKESYRMILALRDFIEPGRLGTVVVNARGQARALRNVVGNIVRQAFEHLVQRRKGPQRTP